MIYGTLFVEPPYLNNKIFDFKDTFINRDNCMLPWIMLKKKLYSYKIELSTQDIIPLEKSDFSIFIDIPNQFPPAFKKTKSILILLETEVVKPHNWFSKNLDMFDFVLTWNDNYVDNVKFFKCNFIQPSFVRKGYVKFIHKKDFVMIAGNKTSNYGNELYTERLRVLNYFNKRSKHKSFDLYGYGWDVPLQKKANRLIKKLLKLFNLKNEINYKKLYRGSIITKCDVLQKYKFCFCFENAYGYPGYITEKIFDCFISGVVPIYLGPPNADLFLDKMSYIDMNNFASYDKLFKYTINMKEIEYNEYLNFAMKYLESNMKDSFSIDYFINQCVTIMRKMDIIHE